MLDPQFLALINTMGQAILIETFKMAAFYVCHSNGCSRTQVHKLKEGSSCFLFIQGTGLDNLINNYSLAYDPERLREGFNYCLKKNFQPLVA